MGDPWTGLGKRHHKIQPWSGGVSWRSGAVVWPAAHTIPLTHSVVILISVGPIRFGYGRQRNMAGIRNKKTPKKFADTLRTTFSGVTMNDVEYLVERKRHLNPVPTRI